MSRVQLALNVSDLDDAVEFYSKLFATEPAKLRPGYANFAVADPPLKLILIEGAGQPASLNHLGVEVEDTAVVASAQARLAEEELPTASEEGVACCYAVQDKVWVDDPDGAPWEIYSVLDDAEVPAGELRTVESAEAIACCSASLGAAESATDGPSVEESVRRRYAELAETAAHGGTCCGPDEQAVFGSSRYGSQDLGDLPEGTTDASLGCGNPTAVADLAPGEIVLDLGSGGGIDVILSARRVGPAGYAYGLDMTDEMLDLARANAAKAGVANIEFLKGHIERIPLPDDSVDVAISNCVINLSTDKASVIAETARVLRPGGRFAVTDVIADPDMDEETRQDVEQWTGCIAGALTREDYAELLRSAGFSDVEIVETHRFHAHAGSAIIRARKPRAEAVEGAARATTDVCPE